MDKEVETGWMDEALRKRLTELLPEMEGQASLVSASLSRNQGLRSLLLLHRDNSKKEIKDYCHQLQKLIADCQKSLIEEVAYWTQQKEKRLLEEREYLNCIKERIIHCRESAGVLLKVGHEQLLTKKGKEVIKDISSLLKTNICEAPMDIKYLSFHPVMSFANFKDAEYLGYIKSTAIELPDVNVTSLCNEAFVGATESLILRVANKAVPEGANVIQMEVTDPKGGSLEWEVEDNEDGSYCITYTPQVVGLHLLTVKIYHCHVKGSPFRINVAVKSEAGLCEDDKTDKTNRPRISEGAINAVNKLLVRRSLTKRSKAKSDPVTGGHLNELGELRQKLDAFTPETYEVMRSEGPLYADRGENVNVQAEDVSVAKTCTKDQMSSSKTEENVPNQSAPTAQNITVRQVTQHFHAMSVQEKQLQQKNPPETGNVESLKMTSNRASSANQTDGSGEGNARWGRSGGWLEKAKKNSSERLDGNQVPGPKLVNCSDTNYNRQGIGVGRSEESVPRTRNCQPEPGASRSDVHNWRAKLTSENSDSINQNDNQSFHVAINSVSSEMTTDSSQWRSQSVLQTSSDGSNTTLNGKGTEGTDSSQSELHVRIPKDDVIKSEPPSPLHNSPGIDSLLQRGVSSPDNAVGSFGLHMKVKSEPIMEVHSEINLPKEGNSSDKPSDSTDGQESPFKCGSGIKGRGRRSSLTKEPAIPGGKSAAVSCLMNEFARVPLADKTLTFDSIDNITGVEGAAAVEELTMARIIDDPKKIAGKRVQSPVKRPEINKQENVSTLGNVSTDSKSRAVVKEEVKEKIEDERQGQTQQTSLVKHSNNINSMASEQHSIPQTPKQINYAGVSVVFQRAVTAASLEFPIGVHATKDVLAVGNSGGPQCVLLFDSSGNLTREIGGQKTFRRPSAVLIHEDKLFIKDDLNVHVYDIQGNYRYSFANCKLKMPYGLAFTPSGTILVLEHSKALVYEFYTTGILANQWSFPPLVNCPKGPKCRFLGVHGHTLVVTDLGINAVHFLDLRTKMWVKSILHEKDSSPGYFNEPSGVTFDPAGNVLIADSRNNRIQVFTKDGQFISILSLPKGKIYRPADIHLTPDGTLYVANLLGHNVAVFKILY